MTRIRRRTGVRGYQDLDRDKRRLGRGQGYGVTAVWTGTRDMRLGRPGQAHGITGIRKGCVGTKTGTWGYWEHAGTQGTIFRTGIWEF